MFTPSISGRENDMIRKWTNTFNCTMPTKKSATTKAKKSRRSTHLVFIFSPILYYGCDLMSLRMRKRNTKTKFTMGCDLMSTQAEAKYEGEVWKFTDYVYLLGFELNPYK